MTASPYDERSDDPGSFPREFHRPAHVEGQCIGLARNPAGLSDRGQPQRVASPAAPTPTMVSTPVGPALEARERHRRCAEDCREHSQPQRRSYEREREALAARSLDEGVARVVHRLADQRGAETERDAVDRTEIQLTAATPATSR